MARVKRAVALQEAPPRHPRAGQGLLRQQEPFVPRRQRAGHALPAVRLPRPPGPQGRVPQAVDPAHQRRLPPERHQLQPVHRRAEGRRASRSTARSSPTSPSPSRRRSPPWSRWPRPPSTRRRPRGPGVLNPVAWPSPAAPERVCSGSAQNPAVQHLRRLSRRRSARTDAGRSSSRGPCWSPRPSTPASRSRRSSSSRRGRPGRRRRRRRWPTAPPPRASPVHDLAAGVLAGVVDTVTPQRHGRRRQHRRPSTPRRRRRRRRRPGARARRRGRPRQRRHAAALGRGRRAPAPWSSPPARSTSFSPKVGAGLGRLAVPRAGRRRRRRRSTCSTALRRRRATAGSAPSPRRRDPTTRPTSPGPSPWSLGSEAHGLAPDARGRPRHASSPSRWPGEVESPQRRHGRHACCCFEAARQRRARRPGRRLSGQIRLAGADCDDPDERTAGSTPR